MATHDSEDSDPTPDFGASGTTVYGIRDGQKITIADTESPSWAHTIAEALNNNPDACIA